MFIPIETTYHVFTSGRGYMAEREMDGDIRYTSKIENAAIFSLDEARYVASQYPDSRVHRLGKSGKVRVMA